MSTKQSLLVSTLERVLEDISKLNKVVKNLILLSWACHPVYVVDLLTKYNLNEASTLVFHQRWAYDQVRLKRSEKKKFKESVCESKVEKQPSILFFQCKSEYVNTFQLHAKCVLVEYEDGSVEYIQPSWNLSGTEYSRNQHLIYRGVPRNLSDLSKVLVTSRFQEKFTCSCVCDQGVAFQKMQDTCSSVNNSVATHCRTKEHVDDLAYLVVTLPRDFEDVAGVSFQTLENGIQTSFTSVLSRNTKVNFQNHLNSETTCRYVAFYNFVETRLMSGLCKFIGSVFNHPSETLNPAVVLSFPDEFKNSHKYHDKFVYKMRQNEGGDLEVLWVFFCSHNLTPKSWLSDQTKNIEAGVLLFPRKSLTGNLSPTTVNYLLRYYNSEIPSVEVVRIQCSPDFNEPGQDEPQDLEEGRLRDKGNTTFYDRYHSCKIDSTDAYDRFVRCKECLVNHLLVNRSGVEELKKLQSMVQDNYTRYALYDYVFNDVGAGVEWKRGCVFPRASLRSAFKRFATTSNPPWYHSGVKNRDLTLETLIDVFCVWGKWFEYYDPSILVVRPKIDKLTLVHYGSIHYNKNSRFIENPKKHVTNPESVTPYDTLSFLVQHMYEEYEVWWKCSLNKKHQFFSDVKSMCRSPYCMVCKTSEDVKLVYDTLQAAGVSNLTVEFVIMRRETVLEQSNQVVYHQYYDGGLKMDLKKAFCVGKELRNVTSSSLGNLRYDLFFTYQNQVCAIEIDDASHQKKETSKVNSDAIKNVMSYTMNIHLLRIFTKENMNQALLPGLVKRFLHYVSITQVEFPTSFGILHNYAQSLSSAINPVTISNPKLSETDVVDYDETKPISLWLAGGGMRATNDGRVRVRVPDYGSNIEMYMKEGKVHVAYDESTKVILCDCLDVFALWYNFSGIVNFLTSRETQAVETWFNGISKLTGTLQETEYGVAVIGQRKISNGRSQYPCVRLSEVFKGEYDNIVLKGSNEFQPVEFPYRFVRLFQTFKPPNQILGVRRQSSRLSKVGKLESWVSPGSSVWVSESEGSGKGRILEITDVKSDMYRQPWVYFKETNDSPETVIGPRDIGKRIYSTVGRENLRKGVISKFIPV